MVVTAPGSLFYSPVEETQVATLTTVGARISGGAQAANVATGVAWSSTQVTTAYDLLIEKAYRDQLVFDQFATKRPTRLTHNGAIVSFPLANDIADDVAGATLQENFDVLPSQFKTAHVDIGMLEYGRVITRTNLVRGMSAIPFDPIAAERIARNSVSTMDRLALASIYAAGGVSANTDPTIFGTPGGVPATVTATAGHPTYTLQDVAQNFQTNNIEPFSDGTWAAIIRPGAITALRREADAAGWRYFQVMQEPGGGTGSVPFRKIGVYENFTFFTSNRLTAAKDIFMGADALAKVYPNVEGFGPQAASEVSPVNDRLRRFLSTGWLWTGGYGRYKAEAIVTANLMA